MADHYASHCLKISIAQLCTWLGFNNAHSHSLDVMENVSAKFIQQIAKLMLENAELRRSNVPNIDDLGTAFNLLSINPEELEDYAKHVNIPYPQRKFMFPVPKFNDIKPVSYYEDIMLSRKEARRNNEKSHSSNSISDQKEHVLSEAITEKSTKTSFHINSGTEQNIPLNQIKSYRMRNIHMDKNGQLITRGYLGKTPDLRMPPQGFKPFRIKIHAAPSANPPAPTDKVSPISVGPVDTDSSTQIIKVNTSETRITYGTKRQSKERLDRENRAKNVVELNKSLLQNIRRQKKLGKDKFPERLHIAKYPAVSDTSAEQQKNVTTGLGDPYSLIRLEEPPTIVSSTLPVPKAMDLSSFAETLSPSSPSPFTKRRRKARQIYTPPTSGDEASTISGSGAMTKKKLKKTLSPTTKTTQEKFQEAEDDISGEKHHHKRHRHYRKKKQKSLVPPSLLKRLNQMVKQAEKRRIQTDKNLLKKRKQKAAAAAVKKKKEREKKKKKQKEKAAMMKKRKPTTAIESKPITSFQLINNEEEENKYSSIPPTLNVVDYLRKASPSFFKNEKQQQQRNKSSEHPLNVETSTKLKSSSSSPFVSDEISSLVTKSQPSIPKIKIKPIVPPPDFKEKSTAVHIGEDSKKVVDSIKDAVDDAGSEIFVERVKPLKINLKRLPENYDDSRKSQYSLKHNEANDNFKANIQTPSLHTTITRKMNDNELSDGDPFNVHYDATVSVRKLSEDDIRKLSSPKSTPHSLKARFAFDHPDNVPLSFTASTPADKTKSEGRMKLTEDDDAPLRDLFNESSRNTAEFFPISPIMPPSVSKSSKQLQPVMTIDKDVLPSSKSTNIQKTPTRKESSSLQSSKYISPLRIILGGSKRKPTIIKSRSRQKRVKNRQRFFGAKKSSSIETSQSSSDTSESVLPIADITSEIKDIEDSLAELSPIPEQETVIDKNEKLPFFDTVHESSVLSQNIGEIVAKREEEKESSSSKVINEELTDSKTVTRSPDLEREEGASSSAISTNSLMSGGLKIKFKFGGAGIGIVTSDVIDNGETPDDEIPKVHETKESQSDVKGDFSFGENGDRGDDVKSLKEETPGEKSSLKEITDEMKEKESTLGGEMTKEKKPPVIPKLKIKLPSKPKESITKSMKESPSHMMISQKTTSSLRNTKNEQPSTSSMFSMKDNQKQQQLFDKIPTPPIKMKLKSLYRNEQMNKNDMSKSDDDSFTGDGNNNNTFALSREINSSEKTTVDKENKLLDSSQEENSMSLAELKENEEAKINAAATDTTVNNTIIAQSTAGIQDDDSHPFSGSEGSSSDNDFIGFDMDEMAEAIPREISTPIHSSSGSSSSDNIVILSDEESNDNLINDKLKDEKKSDGTESLSSDAAKKLSVTESSTKITDVPPLISTNSSTSDIAVMCPVCKAYNHDDPTVVWLQCDKCMIWYHLPCLNMSQSDIPPDGTEWACPTCRKSGRLAEKGGVKRKKRVKSFGARRRKGGKK